MPSLNQYLLINFLMPIQGQKALFTFYSSLVHLHLFVIRPCPLVFRWNQVVFNCNHMQSLAITLDLCHSILFKSIWLFTLKVIQHTSCIWVIKLHDHSMRKFLANFIHHFQEVSYNTMQYIQWSENCMIIPPGSFFHTVHNTTLSYIMTYFVY